MSGWGVGNPITKDVPGGVVGTARSMDAEETPAVAERGSCPHQRAHAMAPGSGTLPVR